MKLDPLLCSSKEEKLKLHLSIKRLKAGARLPQYATTGAAGLDLYACLGEPLSIPPDGVSVIPTGLAMAIPDGHVGLIRDRSSLAVGGLHTVAGVIDSDYRGEVLVAVHNAAPWDRVVQPGERVAQILVLPCPAMDVVEAEDLSATERGSGGFGSTGR